MNREERDSLAQETFGFLIARCPDAVELYGVLGRLRFMVEREIAAQAREDMLHHHEAVAAIKLRELRTAAPEVI